jgi:hypothetical protein
LIGTKGEIQGVMEEGRFVVRHPDAREGSEYSEDVVELDVKADAHGGGDMRLVEDFLRVLRGERPSISSTNLLDSIYGHLIGFEADRARVDGSMVTVAIPDHLIAEERSYALSGVAGL